MNNIVSDLVFVKTDYNNLIKDKEKLVKFLTNLKNNSISDDEDELSCHFGLDDNGRLVINPKTTGNPILGSLSSDSGISDDSMSLFTLNYQYANNTCVVKVSLKDLANSNKSVEQFADELLKEYANIVAKMVTNERKCTPAQLNMLLTENERAFSISDYNKWLAKHLLELSHMEDSNELFTDFKGKYCYTPEYTSELLLLLCESTDKQALFTNQSVLHLLTELINNVYHEYKVEPTQKVATIIETIKHNNENS